MTLYEQYQKGEVTHKEYYSQIVKSAGIFLGNNTALIQKALQSINPHYNDIPLVIWDQYAEFNRVRITRALKDAGSGWSLSQGVCTMKQAVREIVEKIQQDSHQNPEK